MLCHISELCFWFMGMRGSSKDVEHDTGYQIFRVHSSINCPFAHPAYLQNKTLGVLGGTLTDIMDRSSRH